MNTKCIKGKTCTDCTAEDYERKARIKELLHLLETHSCAASVCFCIEMVHELAELGHVIPMYEPVDDVPF